MQRLAFCLIAAALGACAAAPDVRPVAQKADLAEITADEQRLWKQAADFDEQLSRADKVYGDPALHAYLQRIMDRLYPDLAGAIRVRALKSPALNAFALPNGSVYINVGMLARLDNEAQLATVLGHEGAHFTNKHGYQHRAVIKSSTAFAVGLAVTGVPLLGDLMAASSIFGFSRDLEREADRVAFERLRSAGYATAESKRVFEHLAAESKALDRDEPYFFASHPKLRERIESFGELIAAHGQDAGRQDAADYLAITADARVAALEADRALNRHASLILNLEAGNAASRFAPHLRHYYLGEAYRQRGQDGDLGKAAEAYRQALAARGDFAPPYRGLGVVRMKEAQYSEAAALFGRYLTLLPGAADRGYIEQYLDTLRQKEAAQ